MIPSPRYVRRENNNNLMLFNSIFYVAERSGSPISMIGGKLWEHALSAGFTILHYLFAERT